MSAFGRSRVENLNKMQDLIGMLSSESDANMIMLFLAPGMGKSRTMASIALQTLAHIHLHRLGLFTKEPEWQSVVVIYLNPSHRDNLMDEWMLVLGEDLMQYVTFQGRRQKIPNRSMVFIDEIQDSVTDKHELNAWLKKNIEGLTLRLIIATATPMTNDSSKLRVMARMAGLNLPADPNGVITELARTDKVLVFYTPSVSAADLRFVATDLWDVFHLNPDGRNEFLDEFARETSMMRFLTRVGSKIAPYLEGEHLKQELALTEFPVGGLTARVRADHKETHSGNFIVMNEIDTSLSLAPNLNPKVPQINERGEETTKIHRFSSPLEQTEAGKRHMPQAAFSPLANIMKIFNWSPVLAVGLLIWAGVQGKVLMQYYFVDLVLASTIPGGKAEVALQLESAGVLNLRGVKKPKLGLWYFMIVQTHQDVVYLSSLPEEMNVFTIITDVFSVGASFLYYRAMIINRAQHHGARVLQGTHRIVRMVGRPKVRQRIFILSPYTATYGSQVRTDLANAIADEQARAIAKGVTDMPKVEKWVRAQFFKEPIPRSMFDIEQHFPARDIKNVLAKTEGVKENFEYIVQVNAIKDYVPRRTIAPNDVLQIQHPEGDFHSTLLEGSPIPPYVYDPSAMLEQALILATLGDRVNLNPNSAIGKYTTLIRERILDYVTSTEYGEGITLHQKSGTNENAALAVDQFLMSFDPSFVPPDLEFDDDDDEFYDEDDDDAPAGPSSAPFFI